MERNQERERTIEQLMPKVEVPAIKLMWHERVLYVQMNIKSFVVKDRYNLSLFQGFLFAVELRSNYYWPNLSTQGQPEISLNGLFEYGITSNNLPQIRLVGDFPQIFHPHFTEAKMFRKSEWIDYIDGEAPEKDLGSYILRVARSLKYENGYVNPDARKIANPQAANWYKKTLSEKPELFPTDNIPLPSGKTFEIISSPKRSEPQVHHQPKFQLVSANEPQRKVKFEVKESKPAYSPIEKKKTDMQILSCFNSNFRMENDSRLGYEFYQTMITFQRIKNHIAWGKSTHENSVEQGGILLGTAYRNPDTGVVYAIAEEAIPGRLAIGSPGYLEVTHETWKEMLDQVDRLGTNLQIIGWYHTHPNNLDVFMSGTDRTTQARLFSHDWQFAIVLNPQKEIWRAFYGSESRECRGYVLASKVLLPSQN